MVDAPVGVDDVFDGFAQGERGLESGRAGFCRGGGFGGEVGRGGVCVGCHLFKCQMAIQDKGARFGPFDFAQGKKRPLQKPGIRLLVEYPARPY